MGVQTPALSWSSGPYLVDAQGRTTGWGEVEWFHSFHFLPDGATPAEVLVIDPQAVLRAACTEFDEDN